MYDIGFGSWKEHSYTHIRTSERIKGHEGCPREGWRREMRIKKCIIIELWGVIMALSDVSLPNIPAQLFPFHTCHYFWTAY